MFKLFRSRKRKAIPLYPSTARKDTTMLTKREPAIVPSSSKENSTPPIWMIPLPPDIIYYIVEEHLESNFLLTIKSLSLTCRSLVPYCRTHLFRKITIGYPPKLPRRCPYPPAEQFSKLIDEAPDILDYISELHIIHIGERNTNILDERPITREESSLCRILTRNMQKLSSLYLIHNGDWALLCPAVREAFHAVFQLPTLVHVSLENVKLPVNLLGLFRNAKRLEFCVSPNAPMASLRQFVSGHLAEPETLCIRNENGFNMKNVFHAEAAISFACLRSLEFEGSARVNSQLQGFFNACPNILTSLNICLRSSTTAPDSTLYLGGLRALTTLHFCIEYPLYLPGSVLETVPRRKLEWFTAVLKTIRGTNVVEYICITVDLSTMLKFHEFGWSSLDNVFIRPHAWPRLHTFEVFVRVNVSHYSSDSTRSCDLDVMLRKVMPITSERGILRARLTHERLNFGL